MEMTSWGGMGSHSPASYISSSDWLYAINSKTGNWTMEENKVFENALAIHDKETPDRWQKIVEMIPGKSLEQVKTQYRYLEEDVGSIEAGLFPIPGYNTTTTTTTTSPPFTLHWVNTRGGTGGGGGSGGGGGGGFHAVKRPSSSFSSSSSTTTTSTATYGVKRSGGGGRLCSDHERKKGVPWTEEEHRLFLFGLKKYGKGDWRNISRNFVISRTPTQVASHAQKYFIRLSSGRKDKRRSSIHDITTVNLPDDRLPPPPPPSPQQPPRKEEAAASAFFNSNANLFTNHHHTHHQSAITSTNATANPPPY